jgi:transposase
MLQELRMAEQRYRAVWEVLEGASVTEVARRFGVSRQSVHAWLRRYAADGGLGGLGDRSSRPHSCPHQMNAALEVAVIELRQAHPAWGADRIRYQLARDGVAPAPGRTSIYRALVRHGLVEAGPRRRRRSDYRRWERSRPMELWQMDVVGGFRLVDGTELKAVSGIDDASRFVVSAMLVVRATAKPVCDALLAALRRHGIPEQILTDIQAMWCPEVPGLSGRRCEDRWVRHPPIVVASPIGARRDSLPVDHVGVRGLLPETGHPVRNLATAPNSPRIPVSECLVRLVLMRQWAVDGS